MCALTFLLCGAPALNNTALNNTALNNTAHNNAFGVFAPATASAEPPLRLEDRVIDHAGVLSTGDIRRIRAQSDALYSQHRIRLWVIYTDSFDGVRGQTWTESTAELSGLGDNDVLLAVAVSDREYGFSVPEAMAAVSASQERAILRDDVEPALADGRWATAAVRAAEGLASAAAPTAANPVPILIVIALIGGFIVYAFLRTRRRNNRAHDRNLEALDSMDLTDRAALARVPVAALDTKSKLMLVDTDDAIRTSEEELAQAREEFGARTVSEFTAAVENSKLALSRAFEIRQRLDDAIPETPPQRQQMLIDLIVTCAKADKELDAHVDAFDEKRDLLLSAPERLSALTQDVVGINVRIPEAEGKLRSLQQQFPASALACVNSNVSLAQDRVVLAEEAIAEARAALGSGDSAVVVASVRAAESAVSQANELLDAVAHADDDIRTAITRLPGAMRDLEHDIEQAHQLANSGGEELAAARRTAEEALGKARDSQESDPLASLHYVVEADAALDDLLARAKETAQRAEHARRALATDLSAADAHITAARDYISTRRGAIGALPRTRLSEAERHAAYARHISQSDAVTALEHARAAVNLAQQALQHAQREVSSWEAQRRSHVTPARGGSSPMASAMVGGVLGGILMDAMRSSGGGGAARRRSGGFGGSFGGVRSSGGRRSSGTSSRSFGGPRSSGRRTSGGRF